MSTNEVLAFARFQRAVNHLAVAIDRAELALLTGSDRDVRDAKQKVDEATEQVTLTVGRALMERQEAIRAGRVASVPADGHAALEPDEEEIVEQAMLDEDDAAGAGPGVEHRSVNGNPIAACGAAMSESDPAGERCQDCEAELMRRIGTVTHTSGGFGISSDSFRSR